MEQEIWVHKALNVMMRVASLASKLVLTLYMGRYLSLSDMGIYGLVFGAVMLLSTVLGGRIDFAVVRDLVGETQRGAFMKIRDETVFYGLNFILFTLGMLVALALGVASPKVLAVVYGLSLLESLSNMTFTNLIAVGHPLLATVLFFIRAGLWGLVVVVLGLLFPATRHVQTVLVAWAVGSGASLLLTLYVWRDFPWRETFRIPVDWPWLLRGAKQSFGIWLGTIGGLGALYVDRFVVSYALSLEEAGILTFFGSFSTALLSLVQSGFFAFSYPKLIKLHKSGDTGAFWRVFRQTSWQVALFVFVSALAVGTGVPLLSQLLGKEAIAAEKGLLWLLLVSIWIKGNADSLYYVLYARHQDRPNWLGLLLSFIPAALGNLVLVPWMGLDGVGWSAILAASFLLFWRLYYVMPGAKGAAAKKV